MFSLSRLGSGAFGLLLLTFVAFVVVLCCFIWHLKHHFSLVYKSKRIIIISNASSSCSAKQPKLSSSNNIFCLSFNGDLEFYPLSILCYFAISLLSIIAMAALHHESYQSSVHIIKYCPIQQNILSFWNNPMQTTSMFTNDDDFGPYWLYIVLLLLLIESLFNFYRFYDAKYMILYVENATKLQIFALFSIYMMIFSVLYLIQIHLYFGLLPIIILMHFTFNIHCILRFVLILKRQCNNLCDEETESVKSKLIIKRLNGIIHRVLRYSMTTTITSTLSLLAITGCYSSHIIIVLPIFWTICSIFLFTNFAKNEAWINNQCKHLSSSTKCNNKLDEIDLTKNHSIENIEDGDQCTKIDDGDQTQDIESNRTYISI